MDARDPRARRVAAAARSPFPALRKYAAEVMAEPEEHGYFTDPDPEPEPHWIPEPDPDPVPVNEPVNEPEPEPEPVPLPVNVPVNVPPSDDPRPLYKDILLAAAVSFVAFFAVRPLVPPARPPTATQPFHLTDRSGGTLEATLGAPVSAVPPSAGDVAVEIPLPDWPTPSPSASAAPAKRVGVWLTVQSPAELAQIYTALSRHHLERENWDQARYYADKVLGTWPDNADARRLRDAARKGLGVNP